MLLLPVHRGRGLQNDRISWTRPSHRDGDKAPGAQCRFVVGALVLFCTLITTIHLRASQSAPTSATARGPREIASTAFRSTVMLIMKDSNGDPITLGSGFVVGKGVIATNVHVVAGSYSGVAKLVKGQGQHVIAGVLAADPAHDLVLVSVPDLQAPPLTLSGDRTVAGDKVYAVGNPEGFEGTFSEGIVSSIREQAGESLLQITAPISPGSSGGPVLDTSGSVVGVAVATYRSGQNLNFAVPAKYVRTLLGGSAKLVPLQTFARTTNAGQIDRPTEGLDDQHPVTAEAFRWGERTTSEIVRDSPYVPFSLSLWNHLDRPVQRVVYLVVFYDRFGKQLDAKRGVFHEILEPGFAHRIANAGSAHVDVRTLSSRTEIRILDFSVAPPVSIADEIAVTAQLAIHTPQRYGDERSNVGGANYSHLSVEFDTHGVDFESWARRFIARISRNWNLPEAAFSSKGHVVITSFVQKDGSLTDITVVGPCSIESFNSAAYGALIWSNPTDPLPRAYPADKALLTVRFYYNETSPP
jgi:S1-C subfamily serine protease